MTTATRGANERRARAGSRARDDADDARDAADDRRGDRRSRIRASTPRSNRDRERMNEFKPHPRWRGRTFRRGRFRLHAIRERGIVVAVVLDLRRRRHRDVPRAVPRIGRVTTPSEAIDSFRQRQRGAPSASGSTYAYVYSNTKNA
eukprot:31346-Pelagococcus_subviridis.AAC.22